MRRKKKTTRQKDRADSENRLIKAAKEIFSERGYDGATTRMVAERAGINLALITRYFGNKHGLLLAVVKQEANEVFSAPLPYPPQKTLLDECLRFAEVSFSFYLDRIDMIRIIVVQLITDKEFGEAIRNQDFLEHQSDIQERLIPFFSKGSGKKRTKNPEQFLELLKRTIFASILVQFLMGGESKETCIRDLKAMVRMICAGLEE